MCIDKRRHVGLGYRLQRGRLRSVQRAAPKDLGRTRQVMGKSWVQRGSE